MADEPKPDSDNLALEVAGQRQPEPVFEQKSGLNSHPPFEAYRGSERYVFVSYAHSDSHVVFKELQRMAAWGIHIWYDEGIDPGNEWPRQVATALKKCDLFLYFVSPRSVASVNCRNEVYYALSLKKPLAIIHLEWTDVGQADEGLELSIGSLQAIHKFKMPELSYERKLMTALKAYIPQNRWAQFSGVSTLTTLELKRSGIELAVPQQFTQKLGSRGTVLRLNPVEQRREVPKFELLFKTGTHFVIGRSPQDADWLSLFFPRSEQNDARSKRLSKVHARIEFSRDQFWVYRAGSSSVKVGNQDVLGDVGVPLTDKAVLRLAEDYTLRTFFHASCQNQIQIVNGDLSQAEPTDQAPLGSILFDPTSGEIGLRNSCWLFFDVEFGSDRERVFLAGSDLDPSQGRVIRLGGYFWLMNGVDNQKISINRIVLGLNEIVPLMSGDSIWLGDIRYVAQVN